jgi:N-acetyl-gamma-glutamylphosphate reductase
VNNYSSRRPVGVAGFRGYSGAELVRILSRHPGVEGILLEHRQDNKERNAPLGQKPPKIIPADPQAIRQEGLELVFLATRFEVSIELAPGIL